MFEYCPETNVYCSCCCVKEHYFMGNENVNDITYYELVAISIRNVSICRLLYT